MDQIINELSVTGEYADVHDADAGMKQLLKVSSQLSKLGFRPALRTTRDFMTRLLTTNLSIHRWATDTRSNFNRDYQRHFLTQATKSPYIEDFIEDCEEENRLVEYTYNQEVSLGLGLAELWNSAVLSLDCSKEFQRDYLQITKNIVGNAGDEELSVKVLNLWKEEQVTQCKDQIQHLTFGLLTNGQDILQNLLELFPYLRVCDHARKQIARLTGGEQFFPEVVRHLRVLNRTMTEYTGGPFDPATINWSRESRPTMDQFENCRKFICPDGEQRTFELHSKLMSANQRIYFLPITDKQVVYIGYVGKHLPTVDYRT